MRIRRAAGGFALTIMLMAGCSRKDEFEAFSAEYFEAANRWSPTVAVENGLHEFDAAIEDRTAAAHGRRIRALRSQLARLERIRRQRLSAADAIDAEMIESAIRSELFDLEEMRTWQSNPMGYAALAGSAADALIKRDFAPAPQRLRSLIARLKGVPPMMAAMRDNSLNPPREFAELAKQMAAGAAEFYKKDVARWARGAASGDAALAADFETANRAAIESLEKSAAWIESDLMPRSQGQFAIGKDAFAKKLLYEEMVDIPLDRLLRIGETQLEKDYQALLAAARRIDARRAPADVIRSLSDEHPTADNLVESCRRTIEEARQFLTDRKIVTVPSEVRPTVLETPQYARAGSFASMSTPGPFETKATEAYYYVTPPEKDWSAKETEQHLRLFAAPTMKIVTVHEAYPGHYLQFLYSPQFPTKTRKLLFAASNAEGWAHYAEQMMIEEGFGGGDLKLRAAQLQEALIRDCRFVAGIKLHTAGWTVEQATQLFVDKAFHERAIAFPEARRGTFNPTYLYYTLGKLMIQKLRDDYKTRKGSAFSLQGFHDEFVRQGSVPLKIARRLMLGETGSLL